MVWVATRGRGLLRWDGREFEVFSEADGLSDGIVHEVWLDAEGVVWATTDGGLDRLRSAPFITIDRGLGLPFDSPQSIHYGAEGSVWAYAYDERRHFRLDGGLIRKQPGPIRSIDPLLSRHPELIVYGVAHDGGLWATIGKRLFHYREGVFSPRGGIPLPPGDDLVYQVLEDSRGRLWVEMTESGLFLRRPGESRLTPVWNRTSQRSTFGIHLDSREQLWLGLDQPPEVAVFRDTVLLRQLDSSNGLTSAPHVAVTEAGDTTWGYVGGGRLMRIIGNKVTILRNPDVRNLLRTASIALMVEGDYLWLASEGGVTRISLAQLHRAADGDTETVPVRVFDELDGLKVAKLTTLSRFPAFKAADGRLWFSTPAGLAVVDPASITPNPRPPLPHIEELVAAGRVIPQSRRLQIAPNPPRVEIHYTATGLVVPERATIEYRLDGIDHDWVRSGKERMVSYAGLRPRHYTFRVRAWNEDGIPGVAEATLVFRVLPFWYQTWWFLGILLLLVASAGGLVFYAVQRARAKAAAARMRARFEATLAERTRLARELHDTLLQGFTGITLELQAMQRSMIEAPREAAITLARVLTTSDATLREARQMVWDMRAPELDHHDLAEALESAARQATADTPIALDVVIEGIRRRLDIGIETTALRIGREAVVNAVKHAEPTAITISLSFAEKRVSLVVKDNGRGCDAQMLEEAVAGGHWGIRGMQERAARSGGTLDIRGGPGSGTEVALVLPLTS
jgi:signal transduction histidine kinase